LLPQCPIINPAPAARDNRTCARTVSENSLSVEKPGTVVGDPN
jgi:hypothetical protein